MKNTLTTGLLCLLIGIAIGWIAKPNSAPEAPATATTPPTTGSRVATLSPTDPPESKTARPHGTTKSVVMNGDSPDPETQKLIEDSQNRMEKMVIDRQRKKFDHRIAALVKKLNLNPDQETALKKFYEKKLTAMNGFMNMDEMANPEKMKDIAAHLRDDALHAELASLLSPDQLEDYETIKTEDRSRKMDTRALKGLSKLTSVLELSPDQKDAVYDVLYEEAANRVDNPSDASLFMNLSMDGMGLDYDLEDSGIGDAVQLQLEAGGDQPLDHTKMLQIAKDRAAKRIDDKVDALSGVLTEDQTARYREHLESKTQSLFGSMMFGSVETESTSEIDNDAPQEHDTLHVVPSAEE